MVVDFFVQKDGLRVGITWWWRKIRCIRDYWVKPKARNERYKTLTLVKPLACFMDRVLFGARSTVQGIFSLLWGEGGGGANGIKLSCHRGRVILESFLRDKSFILIRLLLEIRGLMEGPSISLQNQHTAEAAKGRTSWKFISEGSSWLLVYGRLWRRKAKCFDFGIWTCLDAGEPEPFMTMTAGSRSISRGCGTRLLSELVDN